MAVTPVDHLYWVSFRIFECMILIRNSMSWGKDCTYDIITCCVDLCSPCYTGLGMKWCSFFSNWNNDVWYRYMWYLQKWQYRTIDLFGFVSWHVDSIFRWTCWLGQDFIKVFSTHMNLSDIHIHTLSLEFAFGWVMKWFQWFHARPLHHLIPSD